MYVFLYIHTYTHDIPSKVSSASSTSWLWRRAASAQPPCLACKLEHDTWSLTDARGTALADTSMNFFSSPLLKSKKPFSLHMSCILGRTFVTTTTTTTTTMRADFFSALPHILCMGGEFSHRYKSSFSSSSNSNQRPAHPLPPLLLFRRARMAF